MKMIRFIAYGVACEVRCEAGLVRRVTKHLPPLRRPLGPKAKVDRTWQVARVGDRVIVSCGRRCVANTPHVEDALDDLEGDVQLFVAEHAHELIFVHAGVAVFGGQAIVLPGRSYAGKSTLVAALLRAGALYYSDEYAVFDLAGRVHPYPRRLALRGSGPRTRRISARQLGARTGRRSLPVALVIACRFRAGARWKPIELPRGVGLLRLLKNTVAARSRPAEALRVLSSALASARVLEGTRAEASQLVDWLERKRPRRPR